MAKRAAAKRPPKRLPTIEEMARNLAEDLLVGIARPNLNNYGPAHEKHRKFHASTARGKLFIGGNRSGKTTSGVVEDLFRCRGDHPFRKVPAPPVYGRVVGTDYLEGIQKILLPEFGRWTPPSMLINGSWEDSYAKEARTLTFENGSEIDFMSYEQKLQKFAGVKRHFIHFDEEPPKDIFIENKTRLLDFSGDWYITMTPVEGMTWTFDDLYEPGTDAQTGKIFVVEIDMTENSYISQAEIDSFVEGLDEDEITARVRGKYVQIGGVAFKKFNTNLHVIPPFVPPIDWKWYASMDHGYNNPTAWLWHAVSPAGVVVTFNELYDRERVASYYAKRIHEFNALPDHKVPDIYVGDPAIAQRSSQEHASAVSVRTLYQRLGIPIVLGNNDVSASIDRINQYIYHDEETKPMWYITQNCPNTIKQVQRARWKPWEDRKTADRRDPREELADKNRHAVDAARYFFMVMPELAPKTRVYNKFGHPIADDFLKPSRGRDPRGLTIDEYLKYSLARDPTPQSQEWSVIDEHMGGLI